jgi:ribosome recycling factor
MKESELSGKCDQAIEHFKKESSKLRTGRVHAGLLDGITVDYYGSSVPLKQIALVNSPEPRQLTVQAYDSQAIPAIEKAIMSSDMGLNPSRDGNLLRVWIPPLTEDRRKESVKALHRLAEDTKVVIRGYRRDIIDTLKAAQKDKEISEDDFHRRQEKVQKTIDDYTRQVDSVMVVKEKELMEL